jgi:hypothetical protein
MLEEEEIKANTQKKLLRVNKRQKENSDAKVNKKGQRERKIEKER